MLTHHKAKRRVFTPHAHIINSLMSPLQPQARPPNCATWNLLDDGDAFVLEARGFGEE